MRFSKLRKQQLAIRAGVGLLLLPVCFLIWQGSASAQSPEPTPSPESPITILVGADQAYPPYEYIQNGTPQGFNIELMQAAAEAMGMRATFRLGPWSEIRQQVLDGKLDALSGLTYSEERDQVYDFSNPHSKLTIDVFVRNDSQVTTLEDLRGKAVIVQAGGIMDDFLTKENLTTNIIRVQDPLEALMLLNNGQYDAALLNKLQGLYFIREMDLRGLRPVGLNVLSINYSFAVQNGNTALIQTLNTGLDILKQNGTYDKLVEKHFGVLEQPDLWQSWRGYILGLGITAILLLGSFFWVWTLRQSIHRRSNELKRIEARYEILVEHANEGIIVIRDAIIVLINPHASNMVELPASEIRGQPFLGFIHPDDKSMVADLYQNRKGDLPELVPDLAAFRILTATGKTVFIEVKGVKIDWEGQPAVMVIFHDISERVASQKALEDSEQRWRLLYDEAPLPYQSIRHDGKIIAVNEEWLAMLGYQREEVLGQPFSNFLTPDSAHNFQKALPSLFQLEQSQTLFFDVVRKDSQILVVSMHGRLVRGEQETHLLCILTDVTASRAAEEALRRSEDKFARVFRTSPDAININRLRDGMYLEINDGFTELTGYTQEDIQGKSSTDIAIWADPADRDFLVKGLRADGEVKNLEARFRFKDGSIQTGLMSAKLIDVNGEPCIISITRDISDRKRNEELVQRQLRYLETLRRVDLAISASIDLKLTLQLFLEQVTTQLMVDAAIIYLLDPQTKRLTSDTYSGFRHQNLQGVSLALGQGYAGQAALTRRTIHDPDFSHADESLLAVPSLREEKFVSYFAVPLIAKNLVVGVLELFHRQPIINDTEWITFMEAMSSQAALAIDNSRLFTDLQRANMDLTMAYDATIEGWARALELRDGETKGHSLRVTALVIELARRMGLHGEALTHIRRGALLHDIGKMAVPDNILLKPGELTEDEWEVMRRHPIYAYEMLADVEFLRLALDIPYCHHEHWDGSGYPRGLAGEAIPLSARIFSVVDGWDALTSDRPYRPAWGVDETRAYIIANSGKLYDPEAVTVFLKMLEDLPPRLTHVRPRS